MGQPAVSCWGWFLVSASNQLSALGVSPPATQQGQQSKIHPAVKLKQANDIFAQNTNRSAYVERADKIRNNIHFPPK